MSRRVLPGFKMSLSVTLFYLTLLILVPLAACLVEGLRPGLRQIILGGRLGASGPRPPTAHVQRLGHSAAASVVLGLLVAWVLVRYEFPSSGCSTR